MASSVEDEVNGMCLEDVVSEDRQPPEYRALAVREKAEAEKN